jgi:predicted NBD/HSP70 family sugar kinase
MIGSSQPYGASSSALRARTEALVLDALRWHSAATSSGFRDSAAGAISRVELTETAGVSRPSVHAALGMLPDALVERAVGGPVRLRPDAGFALGVECGTRQARVAISDLSGNLFAEREPFETWFDFGAEPDPYLDWVAEAIEQLIGASGVGRDEVMGVGISRAAPVNQATGLAHASGLANPDWRDINVAEQLVRRLPWMRGCYFSTDNDASLSALAEHTAGVAKDLDDFIYVKWSDSVATGLLLSSELYGGSVGYAGQIGHLLIDWRNNDEGVLCRVCGKVGCLETKVGAANLAEQLGLDRSSSARIADGLMASAKSGSLVYERLNDAAALMGEAIGSVVDTVNPACIVLGGWLGSNLHDHPHLLASFRRALEEHVMGFARDIPIRRPELRRSAVHGAALQVLSKHFILWARTIS